MRSRTINRSMLTSAALAIAELARKSVPREVLAAYNPSHLEFGHDYIIPKPLDPRLIEVVPAAVARADLASGVARAPYPLHYQA